MDSIIALRVIYLYLVGFKSMNFKSFLPEEVLQKEELVW